MVNFDLRLMIMAHSLLWIVDDCPVVAAFAAGGFGGGLGPGAAGGTNPKGTKVKKNKQGSRSRKQSMLTEVTPLKPLSTEKGSAEDAANNPKLDKWGLPPPTLDDIFPSLPDGTDLRPVDPAKIYTLEDIQRYLQDHINLDLTNFFDENGVGKIPNSDGSKMKVKLLHQSAPVLAIENFMTAEECRAIQSASNSPGAHQVDSATFQGAISIRSSTSWFCNYSEMPILLAKAHHCLNIALSDMEEPQVVRYGRGQEFSWHYDEVPAAQLENGGQRVATLLVYLNTVPEGMGGGTTFRDLKQSSLDGQQPLVMQPKEGSALLFFPAFADGRPDDRTLHKSEIMIWDEAKWIVQMWVHEREYQAVLPPGNSKEAARPIMEEMSRKLGYNNPKS